MFTMHDINPPPYSYMEKKTISWELDEDQLLLEKVKIFGTDWKKIENYFTDKTSLQLKNRWNYLIRKSSTDSSPTDGFSVTGNAWSQFNSGVFPNIFGYEQEKLESGPSLDIFGCEQEEFEYGAIPGTSINGQTESNTYYPVHSTNLTQNNILPNTATFQTISYDMWSNSENNVDCFWRALNHALGSTHHIADFKEIIDRANLFRGNLPISTGMLIGDSEITDIISAYNQLNSSYQITLNVDPFSPLNGTWNHLGRQTFGDGQIQCYMGLRMIDNGGHFVFKI